jgi:hypothetical protein
MMAEPATPLPAAPPPSALRVAIVHEWLVTFAGSERALRELLRLYPQADLFAVVDFLSDADRARLGGRHAKTSFIQNLPGAAKRYRSYLPLMPLAIEQLDMSGYDLVISSNHAVAKGVLTGPDQVHICYCYTPIRYAWAPNWPWPDCSCIIFGSGTCAPPPAWTGLSRSRISSPGASARCTAARRT